MAGHRVPLVDVIVEGKPQRAQLIAYVRTRHGLMARVCWYARIGDSDPEPHTMTVAEHCLVDVPGEEYGDVPVVEAEARRTGRVATGRVWRTG